MKNTVFKFKHKTKTPVRETLKLDSFLIGFTEESSSKTIDRHWKHLRELLILWNIKINTEEEYIQVQYLALRNTELFLITL